MRKSGWYWVKVTNRGKWGCYLWNGSSWEGERGDRYSDELFDVVGPRIPTPDVPLQPAPEVAMLVEALCRCLHEANYSIGCEDALKAQLEKVREIANDALSAYHKQGVEP